MVEIFEKLLELKQKYRCDIEVRTATIGDGKYGETIYITLDKDGRRIKHCFTMDLVICDQVFGRDDDYITFVLEDMVKQLEEETK